MNVSRKALERLYRTYTRREYVHPDPLEFLYDYPDIRDREIVGLVASALAYGRVAQILKSVRRILTGMSPSPRRFVETVSDRAVARAFAGFKHRFSTEEHIGALLKGTRKVLREYGTLNECFVAGLGRNDATVVGGLEKFVESFGCGGNFLLPLPSGGSGCKRLNLFLRWMVRQDAVDPGGWQGIQPSKLIVPLDTHMANIGRTFGLTKRVSAGMNMALEITGSFRDLTPEDPVRYDFALTRFGIRSELEIKDLSGEAIGLWQEH
ncbi:MAG: TIGR02757 family protein [bacterium]